MVHWLNYLLKLRLSRYPKRRFLMGLKMLVAILFVAIFIGNASAADKVRQYGNRG